ncbi:Ser8 [Carabus blaptoides fortunei]
MKYLVVLSALCVAAFGLPHDTKIVGGSNANIEDFPYIVAVLIDGRYMCGGIILNQNSILTAAQCTIGRDHVRITVQAGNNRLGLGESFNVWFINEHPEYDPQTKENDLAVVRIYGSFTYSDKVNQVELVTQDWEVRPGIQAKIAGWGKTHQSSPIMSEYLQTTVTYILSDEDCGAYYQDEREIGKSMICGLASGKGACHGDVGTPMLVNGYLIGIQSWGASCATPGIPVVYSKISVNYDWIQSNL